MTKLAEIEAAALRLRDEERLQLVDRLLGSLPSPPTAGNPEAILAEAVLRDSELESGRVEPLSEDSFWAGIRRAQR